jgi:hypothetical protein
MAMTTTEGIVGRLMRVVMTMYAALAGLAIGFAFYKGNFSPADSEFSGLPLLLLALPWSWWFRDFNPSLVRSQFNNSLLLSSGYVVLNFALLALAWRLLSAAQQKRNRRGSLT